MLELGDCFELAKISRREAGGGEHAESIVREEKETRSAIIFLPSVFV